MRAPDIRRRSTGRHTPREVWLNTRVEVQGKGPGIVTDVGNYRARLGGRAVGPAHLRARVVLDTGFIWSGPTTALTRLERC